MKNKGEIFLYDRNMNILATSKTSWRIFISTRDIKKAEKEKAMRSKIFEDYVPVIIEEAASLAETGVPDYKPVLAKVTRRALAELMGEKIEEDVEEGGDGLADAGGRLTKGDLSVPDGAVGNNTQTTLSRTVGGKGEGERLGGGVPQKLPFGLKLCPFEVLGEEILIKPVQVGEGKEAGETLDLADLFILFVVADMIIG